MIFMSNTFCPYRTNRNTHAACQKGLPHIPCKAGPSLYHDFSCIPVSLPYSRQLFQLCLQCCNLLPILQKQPVLFLQNTVLLLQYPLLLLHNTLYHGAVHHGFNDIPQLIHGLPGSLALLVNGDVRILLIIGHPFIVKVAQGKSRFNATPRSTTLPMRFSISS